MHTHARDDAYFAANRQFGCSARRVPVCKKGRRMRRRFDVCDVLWYIGLGMIMGFFIWVLLVTEGRIWL